MVRTEFGLEYLDRPPNEQFGFGILTLDSKQTGEIVVIGSNLRMVLAERLFINLDRPSNEQFGLRILAQVTKQNGEIIVADCSGGMILAQRLFVDLDRPTIE